MDPGTGSRRHRQLTSGQDTWSARCGESRTAGAEGGLRETTGGNTGTAPAGLPYTAAWSFFPEASPDAGPWVRGHAAAVLDGHATAVAAAIRAAAATGGLSKAKRQTAAKTAGYLDVKAPYLDYPKALAAGWPISSGVIEGTCRHLVKDRMDITGARWGIATAEAILKLRALHANGHFDAYWTHHLQRERERNHGPSYHLAA